MSKKYYVGYRTEKGIKFEKKAYKTIASAVDAAVVSGHQGRWEISDATLSGSFMGAGTGSTYRPHTPSEIARIEKEKDNGN